MLVSIRETCPHCQAFCGTRILFGLNSGLGTPIYTCGNCRRQFASGRRKWDEMGGWFDSQDSGKVRYFLVSVVYVLLLGVIGGGFVGTAIRFVQDPKAKEVPLDQFLSYWAYGVPIGLMIGLLQVGRVRLSKQRTLQSTRSVRVSSFWSFHTNLQLLLLFGMVLPVALCWLIGRLRQ